MYSIKSATGTPLFAVRALYIDGKEASDKTMKDIKPETIEKMEVYKGPMAVEKYGEKGKNGVIMITTKK